jgi:antitoxin component YwqK of YwqJK toxin-antitoxin module
MKSLLSNVFLFSLSIVIISCSDSKKENESNELKDSVSFNKFIDKFKNGNTHRTGTYKISKNKRDTLSTKFGQWFWYYPTGQIEQSANYNNSGRLIGQALRYYQNGKIELIDNYSDESKLMEQKKYSEAGMLTSKFVEENKIIYKEYYYSNGCIKSESITRTEIVDLDNENYRVDTITRMTKKYYYLSGVLYTRGEYINDENNGKYSVWDENGDLVLDTVIGKPYTN